MSDNSKVDVIKPVLWLSAIHVFGLAGLRFHESQEIFQRFIPLYLLVTLGFLFYYQKLWNFRIILFCLGVFVTMFLIEVFAVKTGLLFGKYQWGKAFGIKLFDVPLITGVMWLVLIYTSGIMVKDLKTNVWLKAMLGASLLVLLDVLMEPVSLKFGIRLWHLGRVPIQHYASWMLLAFAGIFVLLNLKAKLRNPLAPYAFCIIAGYFLVANLL